MHNALKCIYPKIWRIPEDFASKCVLRTELYQKKDCKLHVLTVVCGSHLLQLPPYDSALILSLLTDKQESKVKGRQFGTPADFKYKSHSLYRPTIARLVDSVINYRTELFPYFFRKFAELHETQALRSLISVILDGNTLPTYSHNALIEFAYLTSYHLPPTCHSASEDQALYSRFYREILSNLATSFSKDRNSLNKVLLYKLYYALANVPFTLDCRRIYALTSHKVNEVLAHNAWDSKYLIRVFSALHKLELLNSQLLARIYRSLELVLYELDTKDLKLLLAICSKLDDKSSLKLRSIIKEKLALYSSLQLNRMEKLVEIPGKAIVALSKTHPLYQNDKAILSEDAADLIASTVEMRLKQILEIAKILMNRSERPVNSNVLIPEDIRNALLSLNIPDLDGYSNSFDYRYVWATKLFKGNRVIKRESCCKNNLGEKCWGRYRLSQLVKQDLQKPVPAAPGLTVSWSVVDGRVPSMAHGLVEDVTKKYEKRMADSTIKHKLEEITFLEYAETEEKLDNLNTLAKDIKVVESDLTPELDNAYLDKALLDAINRQIVQDKHLLKNQKFVIPKIDYILTKEHKFFLKEIRNMLKRASYSLEPDIQMQYKKVIDILRTSLGLDQLLPELCYLFTTEMNRFKSNQSGFNINILLQYVEALTDNGNIQIHHYVHQLLVPLLEILLSSDSDTSPTNVYRSLVLRKLASQCIYNISHNLKRNNNGLESIDAYLMNLYKNEATSDNCSLTVLYGALCGISKLPIVAKRVVFYPLVPLLLSVVIKKQSRLNVFTKNKQKQKLQQFRQILLHEILHLLLEIIYDSALEDVMSTLEDTGTLLTISYEANIMVNDILMGRVNSSLNPELLLQVYGAILNKCYSLLTSLNAKSKALKRKYEEISTEAAEAEPQQPPEVANMKRYHSLYSRANNVPGPEDKDPGRALPQPPNKRWYDFCSIHALTLTI